MGTVDFPPFRPHRLIRSAHAQTVLGAYLARKKIPYQAIRRELLLDDGDRLVLHDDCPAQWQPGQRVVLLAHGLCGSYRSGYMERIAAKLNARGLRTFRKDLRGFGAGFSTARGHCHAGKSEDLAAVLDYLVDFCPGSPITVVGFSMSGNIVLKMLGELDQFLPPQLDGAIAVGPPIDLLHCARNLRSGLNRFYDWSYVRELHFLVQRRRRVPGFVDLRVRPLPRRLLEFDDRYTAPLNGFSGAEEYYVRSSSAPLLANIQLPTLILAAADDPVIPVKMFERYSMSAAVNLQVTQHGGHCGYLAAPNDDPDWRWLDWRVVDWICAQDLCERDVSPTSRFNPHVSAVTNSAPKRQKALLTR